LDLMGPLQVTEETRAQLVDHAAEAGILVWGSDERDLASTQRVAEMLQLIVATREYQYA
jgi:hypothetical protein